MNSPHTMRRSTRTPSGNQNGAALVVGLILLLVLTLLAITGMNTATTELVMAGNEQFRQNSFNASEAGIEQALTDLATVPQNGAEVTVDEAIEGSDTDTYETSSRYLGDDLNIAGYSTGKFVGFHYEIVSRGRSARNAESRHTQGAYVIQNSGGAGTFGSINP